MAPEISWIRSYRVALLWLCLILGATGLPGDFVPYVGAWADLISLDKILHMILFGVLTITIMFGSAQYYRSKWLSAFTVWAVLISIAIGGLTEVLQGTLFIHRSADVIDFVADSIGAASAPFVYPLVEKKWDFLRRKIGSKSNKN